ncbi:MAG: transcriptional repressor LexA [Puniceicoccales bacterium]|nr:transcriptional repressor LexA [Puniceicoccales bacterium]
MKAPTARQRDILQFLGQHYTTHGYWPSIRDIQAHFQLGSTNGVMGHLHALERKGCIHRIAGTARAYRIETPEGDIPAAPTPTSASPAENLLSIPVYGSIAAGYPDGLESSGIVARLQMDARTASVRHADKTFALRVRGESMINAGILDGDTVILEQGQPRDGDIVAALIDGQTTLKRFVKKQNTTPFLRAENPAFPDIHPVSELLIQGIARSIVRKLA